MDPILAANPFIDNSSFTGSVAYGLPEKPQDSPAAFDSAASAATDWPTPKPLPGAAILEHVPGEILVQFKPGISATQRSQARTGVAGNLLETIHTNSMQATGQGVLERIGIGSAMGGNLQAAIDAISRNPNVAFAELNYIFKPSAVSNDPYYTDGSLWGMYSDDTPTTIGPTDPPGTTNQFGSQAEKAWRDGITGSSSVVVGIIDEGIQVSHPDLVNNIWVNPFEIAGDGIDNDTNGYIDDIHGWDFVSNDNSVYDAGQDAHGTHVAGTIGGEGGNGIGVAGVNWDVTMISAKFLGSSGGTTANAIRAVDYLTDLKTRHGLNLVASNNSWGGGGYSQALHDAIIRHAKADILFVAAAGNSTSNNDAGGYYPSSYNTSIGTSTQSAASYDGVIAVASITNTGAISSFSSYGATTVDLGAPGSGIWSSVPTNSWASYNGTSMATPHVTGAAALYASLQPAGVSAAAIKAALLDSATPTTSLAGKTVTGGRLNVYAALQRASFIDLDRDVYGPSLGAITVIVGNAAANINPSAVDSVQVTLRSTSETTAESFTLEETGANTGIFNRSVSLVSGAPTPDGQLQASHGDTITAGYTPLNQTASARVDAVAPLISNLATTTTATSATLTWATNEAASTEVRYGLSAGNLNLSSTSYGTTQSHRAVLGGLTPGSTYDYEALSRDAAGNLSLLSSGSFTTAAPAPILFVDDDQGATYERFYTAALQANGYSYDSWNVAASGVLPTAADLSRYGLVIWNTGYDFSSTNAGLSTGEQTAIQSYLSGGGKLFLSGQDVLYNGVGATFRQNFLKVASFTSDITNAVHTETGVAGHALSNGLSLAQVRPSDFPTIYTDALTPMAGAEGTLLHNVSTTSGPFSAVNYRGSDFAVVFMTSPFEAISTSAASPNNQAAVLKRTIDYLQDSTVPAGVSVSAPSSGSTTEAGGTVTFTVVLNSAPSGNVTIPVSSSDPSEASVNTTSLVFTPSNWSTPQTVTVTGVNDAIDDGDIAYSVVLGSTSSSDGAYNGLNPADVALVNLDNDTAGVWRSAASATSSTEAGNSLTFQVRLESQPLADVTIPLASSAPREAALSTSELRFTHSNWNAPQTVTVIGLDDWIVDGDQPYSIALAAAISGDGGYAGLNPADLTGLLNSDDDVPIQGATVGPTGGTFTGIYLEAPSSTGTVGGSQTLTEGIVALSGGKNPKRTSGLEYRWSFASTDTMTSFSINAYRSATTEGDDFLIELSRDGGNTWSDLARIGSTSASTHTLGNLALSGSWLVRAIDLDRTDRLTQKDSLVITSLGFAALTTDLRDVVEVLASAPEADENPSSPGTFTIRRLSHNGGAPRSSSALLVPYSLSGTASNGVDYVTLTGVAEIPAGASEVTITVTPLDNTDPGDRQVVLTLQPADGPFHRLGSAQSATVTIRDDDQGTEILIHASSGTAVTGSSSGSVSDTHAVGGSAQVLSEATSGGRAAQRTSALEYRWTFDLGSSLVNSFHVRATTPNSSDGEEFRFEYWNGSSWILLLTTNDSGSFSDYSATLSTALSGTVTVRVVDTDPTTVGKGNVDQISIDHLYFSSSSEAGSATSPSSLADLATFYTAPADAPSPALDDGGSATETVSETVSETVTASGTDPSLLGDGLAHGELPFDPSLEPWWRLPAATTS